MTHPMIQVIDRYEKHIGLFSGEQKTGDQSYHHNTSRSHSHSIELSILEKICPSLPVESPGGRTPIPLVPLESLGHFLDDPGMSRREVFAFLGVCVQVKQLNFWFWDQFPLALADGKLATEAVVDDTRMVGEFS